MGSKMIALATARDEKCRVAACKVYVELLGSESQDPRDLERFKEAAETLGKDINSMTADLQALQTAEKWLKDAEGAVGSGGIDQLFAEALEQSVNTFKKLKELHQEAAIRLVAAQGDHNNRMANAANGVKRLKEMKLERPEVLAHISPPTPTPATPDKLAALRAELEKLGPSYLLPK